MSTSCAPSTAAPTRWLKFLDECTAGDKEMQRFLQQIAGYALTGDTREQCLFFIYGRGRNGKGVFTRAIEGVLGTYAHRAQIETFSAGCDRHPTVIASMVGKRLVYTAETERGKRWAESRIKDLTGGDKLRAHFMRKDEFEFQPRFKLVISGNYEPEIENCDNAMRGRFHVIPFDQTFTGAKADRTLDEKLASERAGILQWAIEGCLDWQRNGLVIPKKVREATAEYFERQDSFAHWLQQETRTDRPDFEATNEELFRSWKKFAQDVGEDPKSQKALTEKLQQRGFKREPYPVKRNGKSVRIWKGIKVLSVWAGEVDTTD
jgi:putative DNA primase/helicase